MLPRNVMVKLKRKVCESLKKTVGLGLNIASVGATKENIRFFYLALFLLIR